MFQLVSDWNRTPVGLKSETNRTQTDAGIDAEMATWPGQKGLGQKPANLEIRLSEVLNWLNLLLFASLTVIFVVVALLLAAI